MTDSSCPWCGAVCVPGSAFCTSCGGALAPGVGHAAPQPALHRPATPDMAGRTCPYCRFPMKEGAAIVECGACHAIHHEDCFSDNQGCAVTGCPGGPATVTSSTTPFSTAPTGPVSGSNFAARPAAIPPPPPQPVRPRSIPVGAIAVVLVLLLGGGAAALLITSSNSPASPPTPATTPPEPTTTASLPTPTTSTNPVTTGTTTAAVPPAPNPTGQDAAGYNTGPGCSDDPSSSLPGCSDSPSTPSGDPEGSCPNGITVDAQTTTCGLAENVHNNYTSDGQVTARSPKTGQNYTFACQTGPSGTTGYTICQAEDNGSTLYLRWHQ